jgi:bacteriocin-like protein
MLPVGKGVFMVEVTTMTKPSSKTTISTKDKVSTKDKAKLAQNPPKVGEDEISETELKKISGGPISGFAPR